MTGYGRGSIVGTDFSVSVDLKTVNNRFLDVHLRLSGELSALEGEIKRRISSRLSRGRVDVAITFERTSQVAFELNRPLIAGYVNALRAMQKEFDIAGDLDINVLARVPGALQPARDGLNPGMISGIEQAIDAALNELERMREQVPQFLDEQNDINALGNDQADIKRQLQPARAEDQHRNGAESLLRQALLL